MKLLSCITNLEHDTNNVGFTAEQVLMVHIKTLMVKIYRKQVFRECLISISVWETVGRGGIYFGTCSINFFEFKIFIHCVSASVMFYLDENTDNC
jgi:hypothetical protein